MKRFSKKSIALFLAVLMMLSVVPMLAFAESESARVPTLEWTEDFEHNSQTQIQWSLGGGTRVPHANNRGNSMVQSIVPSTFAVNEVAPGPNSDPDSLFMGRFASITGTAPRQVRAIFNQPIMTNTDANLTFDWFPGTATGSRYGQLAVQSINHFNSLNYLTFLTIPAGLPVAQAPAGYQPGLYFVVGTTENVTIPNLDISVMPGSANFITDTVNAWYTVSIDFNFAARTMDVVLTNAVTSAPVFSQLMTMADEDYFGNQVTGLQFFSSSIATNAWNTYLDNVSVRVYDGLPQSINRAAHEFGVPQNVIYNPVTTDSVTLSWENMEADGFYVYRRHATDARADMQRIATVVNGFSYVDSGLTGPYYYYQVSAFRTVNDQIEESARTREAFIALQADQEDDIDDFTLISAMETASFAGFGNRIRLGDLSGDGRMDILLTNTLTMGGRNWAPGFPNAIPNAANAPGIVTGGDGGNPRVIYSLTAVDVEGNILWQRCALTGFTGFEGHSREISTGADEPVQIGDVTGNGFNNVILVANEGVEATPAWSAANPWINSVPPVLRANPEFVMPTNYVDRFYRSQGDVLYILDGRTGNPEVDVNGVEMVMSWTEIIARNPDLPLTNVEHLHDQITLANLDGRGINAAGQTVLLSDDPTATPIRQHIIVSHRYQRTTAFELVNFDGEFVMRYMWQYNTHPAGQGGGDTSPHYPLAAPIFRDQGDQRDWIYNNYELLNPETGVPLWRVPLGYFSQRAPHTWDPGAPLTRANHMDSIWVADLFRDGRYWIVKGIDNDNMAVAAMSREGEVLFFNFCPVEAQSANPAWFRTDAEGMMTVGLDRRHRGDYPLGHDGLFLLDSSGRTVFTEPSNFQGWMTTTWAMHNWTGTFSPMIVAFNRNLHAIEAVNAGLFGPEILEANLDPTFFDGYFNPLFTLPELVSWEGLRWMPGNLMGDSRDEVVSFSDRGHIFVFANGVQDPFDGVTGSPRRQTPNLNNWTRYNVGYHSTNFSDKEAATPHVAVLSPTSVEVSLIPIIFAHSYNLYHNGQLVATFNPEVDNLRHVFTDLDPNTVHEFSYTATERMVMHGGAVVYRTTRPSVPFVFNRHLGEVSFAARQVFTNESTFIELTFDRPVSGLTAEQVIVSGFVGDRYGSVVTGELTGDGAVWLLELDEVIEEGVIRVVVANFGSFFVTNNPVEIVHIYKVDPIPRAFSATNPSNLRDLLETNHATLQTSSNLGIFEQHSPFRVPAGRTLYVETTLNIQRGATLIIEGTVVVLPGGRINNQGNNTSGGTIIIEDGGTLLNDGYVENVSNSNLTNDGTIINNARFEIRANTRFTDNGTIDGDTPLSIHRNAILVD